MRIFFMEKKKEKKGLWNKIKYVCSITIEDDGKVLDVIFVLCLISIIAFSVFLYLTFTNFYERLEETMQNNINLNIEIMQNEQMERIQNIIYQFDKNYQQRSEITEPMQVL